MLHTRALSSPIPALSSPIPMHARAVILLACLLLSANLVKHFAWRMTCFSILKESITHYDANVLTSFGACSKIPFENVNTDSFSIHGDSTLSG